MSHLEPGCLIEGGFLQPLCPLSVESLAQNGAVSTLHENMTDKQRDRKGITSTACHHCNVRRQGTNIHLECVGTTQRMMG